MNPHFSQRKKKGNFPLESPSCEVLDYYKEKWYLSLTNDGWTVYHFKGWITTCYLDRD